MTQTKRRGRPRINVYYEHPDKSRHVNVNTHYAVVASATIATNTDRIPDYTQIWFSDDVHRKVKAKWGILEQLGRMEEQDGFDMGSIIYVAGLAAKAVKAGCKSKDVEHAIRAIRMANKHIRVDPKNQKLKYKQELAVLNLYEMGLESRETTGS